MPLIPESFIQDLLNRVDIVEVVERYLPLKKAGQNYVACCPFHKEKSPSFSVSQTKQFYHCFGCGAHGTAISFVMEHQGLAFPEAVRQLAESVGLAVPMETSAEAAKSHAEPGVMDVLKVASDYYRSQLKTAPDAINYLKGRGLTGKTAARFGLGFAPGGDDWQPLKQAFADYDWNKNLAEAGLVVDKEDSKRRYDRFRDRVMFPILSQRGQVIGFGGRVMGKGEPKYLNSPETSVFEKGRELYGLSQARLAIRERGRVMVVEGYMDVVMLHQHGVEYAVATLGTACTPEHVKKLLKLADEVVFCFDGDTAGRKAAWRGLENSLDQVSDGKALQFLFLPPEHDPDSYVQAFGREQFEQMLAQEALPLSQYLLRELAAQVDLSREEGRAKLVHLATPYLARLERAPALQVMLRKRLADLCQLTMDDLWALQPGPAAAAPAPERRQRPTAARTPQRPRRSNMPQRRQSQDGLLHLLQLVLYAPNLVVGSGVFWEEWPQEGVPGMLAAALAVAREWPTATSSALLEHWRDSPWYDRFLAAHSAGMQIFEKFTQEELVSEYASLRNQAIALMQRPMAQERLAELTQRAVNGGLTEEEKQEYLVLVTKR